MRNITKISSVAMLYNKCNFTIFIIIFTTLNEVEASWQEKPSEKETHTYSILQINVGAMCHELWQRGEKVVFHAVLTNYDENNSVFLCV